LIPSSIGRSQHTHPSKAQDINFFATFSSLLIPCLPISPPNPQSHNLTMSAVKVSIALLSGPPIPSETEPNRTEWLCWQ
jgi:hypothetical protein